ncbi:MAG: polyphosphate kinase 2 [Pseudomonadota bacterium]
MAQDIPEVSIQIDGETVTFDLDNEKLPKAINKNAFASGGYPYEEKLDRDEYEDTLRELQLELGKVQAWLQDSGDRVVIVFEGRDAAGKGGTINAFRQYLNPRHARTVALSKPSDRERGQWYFQRYVAHLPTDGELVMFDRSWYNRAGVEPVMGFCSDDQHAKFLEEAPKFEEMLISDGIHFFKFWLNIGQEMQIKRFHDRRQNPLKDWKLSPIDIKALNKWDDYTDARNKMLAATHSEMAPWTIVRTNDKRRGRINAIRHFLSRLDYPKKDAKAIGKIDPNILGSGPDFLNSFGA